MTKADLVKAVSDQTGMTRSEVSLIVDSFIKSIKDAVLDNNRIEIRGFGNFSLRKRKQRTARNPRTGEEIIIPNRFVPEFKISKVFRREVDEIHNK